MPKRFPAIDVSSWQEIIDWKAVKELGGIEVMFGRAGHGLTPDKYLKANLDGAGAQGIYRFVYWYFEPNYDATAQANTFLKAIQGLTYEGVPVLDLETTGSILPTSRVLNMGHMFAQKVDAGTGKVCDIYTRQNFWYQIGGATATWVLSEKRHAWIAQWPWDNSPNIRALLNTNMPALWNGQYAPIEIKPWPVATWWQVSSKYQCPGVKGDVDVDASVVDKEYIKALYNLEAPVVYQPPANYDELVARFTALEKWAIQNGYKIGA